MAAAIDIKTLSDTDVDKFFDSFDTVLTDCDGENFSIFVKRSTIVFLLSSTVTRF